MVGDGVKSLERQNEIGLKVQGGGIDFNSGRNVFSSDRILGKGGYGGIMITVWLRFKKLIHLDLIKRDMSSKSKEVTTSLNCGLARHSRQCCVQFWGAQLKWEIGHLQSVLTRVKP